MLILGSVARISSSVRATSITASSRLGFRRRAPSWSPTGLGRPHPRPPPASRGEPRPMARRLPPAVPGPGAAPVKRRARCGAAAVPRRPARPAAAMGCERGAALLLLPLALQLCPGRAATPAPRGKGPAPPMERALLFLLPLGRLWACSVPTPALRREPCLAARGYASAGARGADAVAGSRSRRCLSGRRARPRSRRD